MCGGRGIHEAPSHGTCWHRLWNTRLDPAFLSVLFLLCGFIDASFSPLWRFDPTTAKENALYVQCKTQWICPSMSLRYHHHSASQSFLNLMNNYSLFLPSLLTRPWWGTWLGVTTLSVWIFTVRETKRRGKASFSFQVVCVSRWGGITAQNQGPTGECWVWGAYGQTGCWWAAYTSFS